jgi:teichuronic acid exporter
VGLKQKTIKGLLWSAIEAIALNTIRLTITIVLARLLSPTDFGLIATLSIFIGLSETLVSGGFASALIQKLNITNEDYSTVFITNLGISITIYLLLFIFSPSIAGFFNEPSLESITRVVALVIIFNSIGIVQRISLRRDLNFKVLAIVNTFSTIVSGAIGVLMAYYGFGVWSLVAQLTLKAFITSTAFWVVGNLKIKMIFNLESFKDNFNFGYKLLLSSIIGTLSMNAYNVVIGKLYNAESLGFFYQAKRLNDFTSAIISNVFQNVTFPLLSSIQDDEARINTVYIQFLRLIAFVSFPVMMLLFIIAEPLLSILLTEKWSESIEYFQILCVSGMVFPLIVLSGHMPVIKGRSDIYLKLTLFYKGQLILALAITASFGIWVMLIGLVIQFMLQFLINIWVVSRLFKISFIVQVRKLEVIFFVSLFVSVVSYFFKYIIVLDIYLLLVQIVIFSIMYLIIQYIIKSEELMGIRNLLLKKFHN